MRIWAIINSGIVTNVILWDPATQPSYRADGTAVEITTLLPVPGVSWLYDGANFTNPQP